MGGRHEHEEPGIVDGIVNLLKGSATNTANMGIGAATDAIGQRVLGETLGAVSAVTGIRTNVGYRYGVQGIGGQPVINSGNVGSTQYGQPWAADSMGAYPIGGAAAEDDQPGSPEGHKFLQAVVAANRGDANARQFAVNYAREHFQMEDGRVKLPNGVYPIEGDVESRVHAYEVYASPEAAFNSFSSDFQRCGIGQYVPAAAQYQPQYQYQPTGPAYPPSPYQPAPQPQGYRVEPRSDAGAQTAPLAEQAPLANATPMVEGTPTHAAQPLSHAAAPAQGGELNLANLSPEQIKQVQYAMEQNGWSTGAKNTAHKDGTAEDMDGVAGPATKRSMQQLVAKMSGNGFAVDESLVLTKLLGEAGATTAVAQSKPAPTENVAQAAAQPDWKINAGGAQHAPEVQVSPQRDAFLTQMTSAIGFKADEHTPETQRIGAVENALGGKVEIRKDGMLDQQELKGIAQYVESLKGNDSLKAVTHALMEQEQISSAGIPNARPKGQKNHRS